VPTSCSKLLLLFLRLTACSFALVIVGAFAQRAPSQDSKPPAPVYLPPGNYEANILSAMLRQLGEPSLYEAGMDSIAHSYRVSYFSPTPVHEVVVRLVVNPDGSGRIKTAESSGEQAGAKVKRRENDVSAADVDRLLQLIEKSGFWATTGADAAETARNTYVFDGSWWMLEGVRKGSFHFIFRRNPIPSPITEIGCYLARDLVTSDHAVIPMSGCK
jgi:hypothetical protein